MPEPGDIIFRVNSRDEIVFVNEEWDRFAAGNAGDAVRSSAVLGRSVWDFLADPTTREIYRRLLQRCRDGRRLRFTLRCDSPAVRRLLQMDMQPAGDGAVELRTHLVSEEVWPTVPADVPYPASAVGDMPLVCSWCKKVLVGAGWVEIEDALPELRLFDQSSPPPMTHGICNACYRLMSGLSGEA